MPTSRSLWDTLFARRGSVHRKKEGPTIPGRKLALEPLERRELLSVRTWDGGGTNNNWTTPANWAGGVAPLAGDDLQFSGTTRTTTQNDFSAGTSFHSIEFAANNFLLAGNGIALTNGITVDSAATTSTISLAIALSTSNSISVASSNTLTISGALSGSVGLAKTGTGTLLLTGATPTRAALRSPLAPCNWATAARTAPWLVISPIMRPWCSIPPGSPTLVSSAAAGA